MARNIERDEREAERRKNQILNAGFELFSENGIEAVSLKEVADKAQVGVATMYNYYSNKTNLVEEISYRMWKDVVADSLGRIPTEEILNYNAYELCEYYCNIIIEIYSKNPKILKFSSDFKTFICKTKEYESRAIEQTAFLKPLSELFHMKYEEAKINHCIRTDVPENELFPVLTLSMLSFAERFAQGIIWADNGQNNHINELGHLKTMILCWIKDKQV